MAFGKKVGGGRREGTRSSVLLPGVSLGVRESHRVALLDVSTTGAKLRDASDYPPGQDLWLKFGAFNRLATVKWRAGDICGVAFDKPLTKLELFDLHRENALSEATHLKPEERLSVGDWMIGLAR